MLHQDKYTKNQFPENQKRFSLRMRNHGFKKKMLAQWLSQFKYSNRTKFLDGNPEDTCYYQGTRENLADTNLINIGRVYSKRLWLPVPKRRRKSLQRTRIPRLLRRHRHIRLFYLLKVVLTKELCVVYQMQK